MRSIDLKTWARRDHFRLFSALEYPHFGLCANVDVTAFRPYVKAHGYSFTVAVIYILAQAANAIRVSLSHPRRTGGRARGRPANTMILVAEDVFSFCALRYRGSSATRCWWTAA